MKRQEIVAFLKTLKPALQNDGIVSLGLFGLFVRDIEIVLVLILPI